MNKGWYIFLYHNVSWEDNDFVRAIGRSCPPDIFREHLRELSKLGEFISVEEGLNRLNSQRFKTPVFSIWFDDSLSGVRRYALPVIEKYNFSAAISVCSRFITREEIFWRFKLSYLSLIDGLRFLRPRLKKYGYSTGASIGEFTLDNFSAAILREINEVFCKLSTESEREAAFNLFETPEGLRLLKEKNWVIANHTAAHYPVGEDTFIKNLQGEFLECESKLKEILNQESDFWVLPFDRHARRSNNLASVFRDCARDKYLVLLGDMMNNHANIRKKILFRVRTPIVTGKELTRFLSRHF